MNIVPSIYAFFVILFIFFLILCKFLSLQCVYKYLLSWCYDYYNNIFKIKKKRGKLARFYFVITVTLLLQGHLFCNEKGAL